MAKTTDIYTTIWQRFRICFISTADGIKQKKKKANAQALLLLLVRVATIVILIIVIYYLHVVALEKLKTMDPHHPAVKFLDTRFSQAHQPTSRKVLSGQSFYNRYHLDEAINCQF